MSPSYLARPELTRSLQFTTLFILFGLVPTVVFAQDLNRPVHIKPEHTRPGEVSVWAQNFSGRARFMGLPQKETGGGTIASGDLDGDGVPEIVVAAGPGSEPYVNIFDLNGKKKSAFLSYEKKFRGGVRVAVDDLDGDGRGEIVTAPGPGREPRIRIFTGEGTTSLDTNALAYSPGFQGGVHLAVADILGDERPEIITTPGPGGGPHVRIWNGTMQNLGFDFFAFDSRMTDGLSVAVIRTPHGRMILTAPESWSAPIIRRFAIRPTAILAHEFLATDAASRSGLTIAAFDRDADGYDEIASASNGGMRPEVSIHDMYGTKIATYLLHDPTYRGSLRMTQIRHGQPTLATISHAPIVVGPVDSEKKIEVDVSEQRLYAYHHGRIAKTFLVSTGTGKYPTPIGTTSVQRKIPIMDYRWSYGVNHPDNYNLKNVRHNLNVFPHIYIHTAYWHNNFGHRMSHGCINAQLKDAEWIYGWADVGTSVETKI